MITETDKPLSWPDLFILTLEEMGGEVHRKDLTGAIAKAQDAKGIAFSEASFRKTQEGLVKRGRLQVDGSVFRLKGP